MVALVVVVLDVLADEEAEVALAEGDDAPETLLFNRPDKPLGIRVEIGTLRRQPNRVDTTTRQDLAVGLRVEGISVVNEVARGPQKAIDRVGQIASQLLHPRAVRLRVDPSDVHTTGA